MAEEEDYELEESSETPMEFTHSHEDDQGLQSPQGTY
jgi:hypothetical protein